MVPRPLLESLARCEAPDLVASVLGKPEIATGSGCDPLVERNQFLSQVSANGKLAS